MTVLSDKHHKLSEITSGFGELLKEERLRQGLSLELVSRKTGINITNLSALEDSARRKLPADVFNRGFIKIYARFLQINPKESLDSYEKEWGFTNGIDGAKIYLNSGEFAKKTSIFEDKQALTFIVIVLVVAAIFLTFHFFTPLRPTDNLQKQFTSPSPSSTALDPTNPQEQESVDHESLYSSTEEKELPSQVPIPQKNDPTTMALPETSPTLRDKIKTTTKITTEPYTLIAEFSERTWLKITIDQNDPAEYTFQANEKHTWQATETFKLIIGNAGGIQLFLNGSKLELNQKSGKVMTLSLP